MITTSSEFGEQMGSNARKIYARFLIDGEVVEGEVKEVKVNQGACGDSAFSVGTVYSSYLTATIDDCPTLLENRELELQIGVELTDGTVEYCTVGFYTASDVATSVGTTTFTGLGRISAKCGSGYWSDNGWPQTVQSALDEIAAQTGVSIDASACDSAALALNIESSMDGLLHREALMYIAGLLGGFATESSDGGIVLRPFGSTVAAEMDADRTTELFEFSDYDYTVTGVEVIVSESGTDEDGNEVEGVSYTYGTPNLTLSNPYMTQALFDLMAVQITGFTYRPGTVPLDLGDIRLEAGDMISTVDAEGVSRTVACLLLEHTFDGGLMTTITAPGESETEQGASFTGSLSAAVEKTATELLVAKQVTATKLEAVQASINELTAKAITAEYLTTNYLTAEDIKGTYATITELTTSYATIEALNATNAAITNLSTVYATIENLNAATANISALTADLASINSLLAGNIGTGTVQTVHLTADNVVIDDAIITDAMIADLSASKLTAGTIYTDKVTIQSESGNLYITDNTIQIQDGTTVRVQIGEDASGDYNLYLWDASGALIWDAQGLTEAGLTGNGAIIKDVAVADDANISGYKIDITTMTSALNEYGELVVDATQITIDDTTLDYKLSSMTTSTAEAQAAADAAAELAAALESEAVASLTQYYALGASAEEPPSDPAEGVTRAAALVDTAVVDESRVDITYADTDWTTGWIVASDGLYLWTAFFVEYADGHTEWTTPTCLSDGVARERISTLVTELEVVQGQITAKVWQTDIDTAVDEVNGTLTTLQDQYAQLVIDLDSISLSVGDLTTTVGDNYEALSSQISSLTVTASEITASVSELEQTVEDNYSTLDSRITTVSETADGISSTVSSLQTTVETNYTDLSSKITMVSETADGITATVSSLQTTVGSNYTELSDKISSLEVTADDITASVSSVQGGLSDLTDTVNGTVTNAVTYFAISGDTSPPCDPGETIIDATVDTAVVDSSLVGCIGWTTERLEADEGEYLWTCNQLTLADGSTVWTTPVLVTDDYARTSVATLAVTATGITATVSDLQSTVSGNYTNLSDKIAALTVTTDSITATVSDLTTTVADNYDTLSDQITAVETTASGISATVSSLQSTVTANYTDLSSQITTLEATASGIAARVTQTESDISANAASITTLSSELTQLADSISLCVTTDADTGYLRLGAGSDGTVKFTIEADNLTLDESGNLAMTGNLTVADCITMSSDTACITGPGRVRIKSIIYGESGIVVPNSTGTDGHGYYGVDTSSENKRMLWMSDSDVVRVGNANYPLRLDCTSLYRNSYATKQIVSIQSVSVSTSGTVNNGSSGTATGTFTAVSGASYLLLPQRANYGYVTEVSYSGTTVTATIYNASGSTRTLAGNVVVLAYV